MQPGLVPQEHMQVHNVQLLVKILTQSQAWLRVGVCLVTFSYSGFYEPSVVNAVEGCHSFTNPRVSRRHDTQG